MKKISFKRLSVLGMVLMAASAVTAAIIPNQSKDLDFDGSVNNGTLLNNSGAGGTGGVKSCVITSAGFNCHLTAGTATGAASEFVGNRTAGNTSATIANNSVDETSAVS